jgi:D-3-phosphoglycerate dehydrogenase
LSFSSARKGIWNKQSGKEIVDAKIGILGFGNVGRTVFHKLRYMSNSQNIFFNDIDSSLVVRYRRNYMDLNTMLSTCDLITIHIDNQNLQNTHFIDGEKMKLIKDGGYLVNTSRGSIMNYLELHMNLERLGGVALDVYPDEPHIPEFLQKSDKVILSCHICGSSESALKQGEDFIKESVINYDSRMISECVSKYLSEKK